MHSILYWWVNNKRYSRRVLTTPDVNIKAKRSEESEAPVLKGATPEIPSAQADSE